MTETTETVDTTTAEGTEERTTAAEAVVEAGMSSQPEVKLTDIQKYFGCSITDIKGLTAQDKEDLKKGLADLNAGGPGNY